MTWPSTFATVPTISKSRKFGYRVPLEERFWKYANKCGPDECWPWLGPKDRSGYGHCWDGERKLLAHRVSLAIDGRDAGKLDALHSCHNPLCVNPAHLRPGTEKENAKDAIDAGRFVHNPAEIGEKNANSILTEKEVTEIRRLYASGQSQLSLGKAYGVSPRTIAKCVHRLTWKHIR